MTGCPFCDIIHRGAPVNLVHDWADAIALVPLAPVRPGHVLVIPRQHVADFTTDPQVSGLTMFRAAELAHRIGGDFNVIGSKGLAATATVKHLHLHLIPRGDGLHLPWTGQQVEATLAGAA